MKFNENTQARINTWLNGNYDDETKQYIKKIIDENPDEIIDAFSCELDFGTGGIRGIMGIGPNRMNKYTVGSATQGLANYLLSFNKSNMKVAIAHDTRDNSHYFSQIAANILSANGIKAYLFNSFRPTPELSFIIRKMKMDAGIVITASHNPKEYNGYKVYWNDGGQLVPPHDKNVIDCVRKISDISEVKFDANSELIELVKEEFDKIYLDNLMLVRLSKADIVKQQNLKIVYTPLHGSGTKLLPLALEKFGFKNIIHVPEQDMPEGQFPTVISPNPEEKAALKMAIDKAKETSADLILATDPDADRVGVGVRNNFGEYTLLNGNQTASLLAYYTLLQRNSLNTIANNSFMVKTIVTTDLLSDIAKNFNVKMYEVLTGFKYIANKILEKEKTEIYLGGGEESYGYLGADFVRDKDALMTSCQIAEVCAWAKNNRKNLCDVLTDIYTQFGYYQESLISLTKKGVQGKAEIDKLMNNFRNNPPQKIGDTKISFINDYQSSISKDVTTSKEEKIDLPKSNVLQYIFEDGSKITVRPSGTEPKIKFYFSLHSEKYNDEELEKISEKEILFHDYFAKQ